MCLVKLDNNDTNDDDVNDVNDVDDEVYIFLDYELRVVVICTC